MQRRKFSREFKLEAVRLVKDRGVAVAQAARDLDVHENVLRKAGQPAAPQRPGQPIYERTVPAPDGRSWHHLFVDRSGNVWDNAAMESFFSSLKTERTARKVYRTRDDARADVFDYIERFYNPRRRHSTLGYMSPVEFEEKAMLA